MKVHLQLHALKQTSLKKGGLLKASICISSSLGDDCCLPTKDLSKTDFEAQKLGG